MAELETNGRDSAWCSMPDDRNPTDEASGTANAARQYIVVARRYRPQAFAELVGQEHVAQALSNAISSGRVGHAYLFTGARGVGKTSAARILAKALNCQQGTSPVPCNQCDICRSISSGEDVDVLEIDGASNRGIDEIRQLRQNVNVRPSRARFKIYIIDEVHMLTREAFNALLKTLEEPPEHVKFIFCTTEPSKIPITILSRCQRFDFAGIVSSSIAERLRQIVAAEGVEAESAALETIARRAAGSMRDSQSLLEQLLSFSPGRITLADVHRMLGTAGDESLTGLLDSLVRRDSAAALRALDEALGHGVDASQLLEQLLGYLRDCMAAAAGCPGESMLYCSPANREQTIQAGKQLGLHTAIAAMQILDQALSRMRFTTQGRVVAELALVRISQLADLDELSQVISRLQTESGPAGEGDEPAPAAVRTAPGPRPAASAPSPEAAPAHDQGAAKKKATDLGPDRPEYDPNEASLSDFEPDIPIEGLPDRAPVVSGGGPRRGSAIGRQESPDAGRYTPADRAAPGPESSGVAPQDSAGPQKPGISAAEALSVWNRALATLFGMVADYARQFSRVTVSDPSRLVVWFRPKYSMAKTYCQRPEPLAQIEQALSSVVGQRVRLEFAIDEEKLEPGDTPPQSRPMTPQQRVMEVMQEPMIQRAEALFKAQVVRVDLPTGRPQGS